MLANKLYNKDLGMIEGTRNSDACMLQSMLYIHVPYICISPVGEIGNSTNFLNYKRCKLYIGKSRRLSAMLIYYL